MAERGGQLGNQNATKSKPWIRAIERALEKRSRVDQVEALDDLAEKLLANCANGDMAALKELGDRLDGKPHQTLSGPNDTPLIGGIDVTLHSTAVRQTGPDEQNKG